MRKYLNFVLILVVIFAAIGIANLFKPASVAFAADDAILIEEVQTVNVYDEDVNFFTVTATVISNTLNGSNVEWLLNGALVTNNVVAPSAAPNTSVVKIYRIDFKDVSSLDVWVFRARIAGQPTIYDEVSVTFKTNPSPISIKPQTPITQQYSPNGMTPFILKVEGLEEETSVQWYTLENSNKFVAAVGTSNQRFYSFTPTSAGEFTFRAKVGTELSPAFKVSVEYAPIINIDVTVSLQLENRNGFNSYLFKITNLDSSNDIENLNWYIEGYANPIQYGGTTFLFQPTAYGTYRIVARYGVIKSTTHTIDVKIDRTVEILIGSAAVVAAMGIALLIIIIKNIKSEKIW